MLTLTARAEPHGTSNRGVRGVRELAARVRPVFGRNHLPLSSDCQMTVFRFPDPPPKPGPKNVYRATFFRMVGGRGHTLTCAAYDTEFGLELRLAYGDDLMRSELFRGIDADDRCAATADSWHLALLEKRFAEQAPQ